MYRDLRAMKALYALAYKEGKIPEVVKYELQKAINEAYENPDPEIRKEWLRIPCEGERPTPEEFIYFVMEQMDDETEE